MLVSVSTLSPTPEALCGSGGAGLMSAPPGSFQAWRFKSDTRHALIWELTLAWFIDVLHGEVVYLGKDLRVFSLGAQSPQAVLSHAGVPRVARLVHLY